MLFRDYYLKWSFRTMSLVANDDSNESWRMRFRWGSATILASKVCSRSVNARPRRVEDCHEMISIRVGANLRSTTHRFLFAAVDESYGTARRIRRHQPLYNSYESV